MDDTSDTCWSWPHWKFGLKRNDLFTKLHEQYNTVPSPILDPEAFHHDVYELSHQASTADELHRLLEDRKQQRVRELNETLESAAFEIIANPSLIGTEQWHHAVQLFRTKSLDSLVRYFASYLPSDHPWYKSDSTSSSDAGSSIDSIADSQPSFFEDDGPIMTDEPFEFSTALDLLPSSPRSMTMCSDSSAASPIDDAHHDYDLPPLTPARTLSFSESERDFCCVPEPHCEPTRTLISSRPSLYSNASTPDVQVSLSHKLLMVLTTRSSPSPTTSPTAKRKRFPPRPAISRSRRRRRPNPRRRQHPSSMIQPHHYTTTDVTEVSRHRARIRFRITCSWRTAIPANHEVPGSGRTGRSERVVRCSGGERAQRSQRQGYKSHCQSPRGRGPEVADGLSASICYGVLAFRRSGGLTYRYPLYMWFMIVHTYFVFMTVMFVLPEFGLWCCYC